MRVLIDYPCPTLCKPYRKRNDRSERALMALEGDLAEVAPDAAPVAFVVGMNPMPTARIPLRWHDSALWRPVGATLAAADPRACGRLEALRDPSVGDSDWRYFQILDGQAQTTKSGHHPVRLDADPLRPTLSQRADAWLAATNDGNRDKRICEAEARRSLDAVLARHLMIGGELHVIQRGLPAWITADSRRGGGGVVEAIMVESLKPGPYSSRSSQGQRVPFGQWSQNGGSALLLHFAADGLAKAKSYLAAQAKSCAETVGAIEVVMPELLPADPLTQAARDAAGRAVHSFARILDDPTLRALDDSERIAVLRAALTGVLAAFKATDKLSASEKIEVLMAAAGD